MTSIKTVIQYLPSSYNVILESVETTLQDLRESLNGRYILNENIQKNYYCVEHCCRDAKAFFRSPTYSLLFDCIFPEQFIENLNIDFMPYASYNLFRIMYQKGTLLTIDNDLIRRIQHNFTTETNSKVKRCYNKMNIWMVNSIERIYYLIGYLSQDLLKFIQMVHKVRMNHLSYPKMLIVLMLYNNKIIQALKLLKLFSSRFFNEITGSSTSNMGLCTYYYMSAVGQRILESQMIIQRNFMKLYYSEIYDYNYIGKLRRCIAIHSYNNYKKLKHLLNAYVYYGENVLIKVNNLVTNTKTSFNIVTKLNSFELDESYHLRCYVHFNSLKINEFFGANELGSCEYVDPVLYKNVFDAIMQLNNIKRSWFFGPFFNLIIHTTYYRYLGFLSEFCTSITRLTRLFNEDSVSFVKDSVGQLSKFFNNPMNELYIQKSLLNFYSDIYMESFDHIGSLEYAVDIIPSTNQLKPIILLLVNFYFRLFLKNFVDLKAIGIYHLGMIKFTEEEFFKATEFNMHIAFKQDFQEFYPHLLTVKKKLMYFLNQTSTQSTMDLFYSLNDTDIQHNIREFAEILISAQNIVLDSKMRLSFKEDNRY